MFRSSFLFEWNELRSQAKATPAAANKAPGNR